MSNLQQSLQGLYQISQKINSKTEKISECSAFEVYPNDQVIPVGENEMLGGYVSVEIPACMTHNMIIRTYCPREKLDIVIDWGDGTKVTLADPNASGVSATTPDEDGDYTLNLEHTYTESAKYIVKIYGKNYYNFGHNFGYNYNNLICRIFSGDLPIASHLRNLSSVCTNALRLLKVVVNGYDAWIENVENMSNGFYACYNLLSATGFRQRTSMMTDKNLFTECNNLVTTDYKLKATYSRPGACGAVFGRCLKLAINDISKLLPDTGFIGSINFSEMFYDCSSISGTVPASKLWEDSNVTWINTSNAFTGCSAEIRAQVPTSWGGTNEQIQEKIDEGYFNYLTDTVLDAKLASINEQIQQLNEKIQALEV